MYEEDRRNIRGVFADPDGVHYTLVVDDEAYAHLLNDGWTVIKEMHTVIRNSVPGPTSDSPSIDILVQGADL